MCRQSWIGKFMIRFATFARYCVESYELSEFIAFSFHVPPFTVLITCKMDGLSNVFRAGSHPPLHFVRILSVAWGRFASTPTVWSHVFFCRGWCKPTPSIIRIECPNVLTSIHGAQKKIPSSQIVWLFLEWGLFRHLLYPSKAMPIIRHIWWQRRMPNRAEAPWQDLQNRHLWNRIAVP